MHNTEEFLNTAFLKYFETLLATGYVDDTIMYLIVLLDYLIEFLLENRCYIDDIDYNMIRDIILCLQDSSCYFTGGSNGDLMPLSISSSSCTSDELVSNIRVNICYLGH